MRVYEGLTAQQMIDQERAIHDYMQGYRERLWLCDHQHLHDFRHGPNKDTCECLADRREYLWRTHDQRLRLPPCEFGRGRYLAIRAREEAERRAKPPAEPATPEPQSKEPASLWSAVAKAARNWLRGQK